METEWTKGPWRVGLNKERDSRESLPVWGPDGQPTCWVEDRGGETRANARLIGAAPELATAVQRLMDAVGPIFFNLNEATLNPDQRHILAAWRAGRAALSLARGES